jgi:hypothetical protein
MRGWAAVLIGAMALAGCEGGSGGGGLSAPVLSSTVQGPGTAGRAPVVEEVLTLSASPTPAGVIVSTVGLPPTQGWWRAELVRVPSGNPSVYAMEFRLLPPLVPRRAGTPPSREVLGGTFLTQGELAGIATIAVLGRSNSRIVSRQ